MSSGSFWSGNLSLSSVMQMCSPSFSLQRGSGMRDGSSAASFCHSCPEKARGASQRDGWCLLFSALFHACIPFPQRPLLPLLLRRTYCPFVLLSSLAFDNWPLPRSEALKKARLSQEGGGIGQVPVHRFIPHSICSASFKEETRGHACCSVVEPGSAP